MRSIDDLVSTAPEATPERFMIQQCSEQFSDHKKDLAAIYEELLSMDIADEDELTALHSRLEKSLLDVSQKVMTHKY